MKEIIETAWEASASAVVEAGTNILSWVVITYSIGMVIGLIILYLAYRKWFRF